MTGARWLRIEGALRAVLGARLTHGASGPRDRALAAVITRREEIARAGWFI